VTGFDAGGEVQVRGRSLGLVIGSLESEVFPVFAQRVDRWSRPPGEMVQSHVGGVGAVLGERYLMLTGGRSIGGEPSDLLFYDMLALGGVSGGKLSIVPESLVVSADGTAALFIGGDSALWLDFQSGDSYEPQRPAGLSSWAQVAGGRTIISPTVAYVVGGTAATASDRVLILAIDRSLSVVTLSGERARAAAVWIDGVGLVVAGGSDTTAGVEVLADGETTPQPLAFDPDPTSGATAVLGTEDDLVLVCGSDAGAAAPIRQLDLACTADCMPTVLSVDLGATLEACHAFAIEGERVLLSGSDSADGVARSFSFAVATADVVELALREPRKGAVTLPAPNGTLAIIGGSHADDDNSPALTIETLFPR